MRFGLLVAAALALSACDVVGLGDPELEGRWYGSVGTAVVHLTLSDADGTVSGSGTYEGPDVDAPNGQLAITVQGVHRHPDVSMTWSAAGKADVNFSGSFTDDDTVSGRLTGAGFDSEALTLRRR